VRELSSPRDVQSASWRIRELSSYRFNRTHAVSRVHTIGVIVLLSISITTTIVIIIIIIIIIIIFTKGKKIIIIIIIKSIIHSRKTISYHELSAVWRCTLYLDLVSSHLVVSDFH